MADAYDAPRIVDEGSTIKPSPTPYPLAKLITQYRMLKGMANDYTLRAATVKVTIKERIEEEGNWKDSEGYARMVTRKESVAYDSSAVEHLAQTWKNSDDPVTRTHGEMLLRHRSEKPGSTYIQIK